MWLIGSAPLGEGAPAVRRTQVRMARGAYPATLPPMRLRMCLAPLVSIHWMLEATGVPSASTGTVLAHCPVTLTATTSDASTAPDASPSRARSQTSCHQSSASCSAPPPGRYSVSTAAWLDHARRPVTDTKPTL